MNYTKDDAMDYGMLAHDHPDYIAPLRQSVLVEKATPEQIKAGLDKFPWLKPSLRMSIEGAARYIWATDGEKQ